MCSFIEKKQNEKKEEDGEKKNCSICNDTAFNDAQLCNVNVQSMRTKYASQAMAHEVMAQRIRRTFMCHSNNSMFEWMNRLSQWWFEHLPTELFESFDDNE